MKRGKNKRSIKINDESPLLNEGAQQRGSARGVGRGSSPGLFGETSTLQIPAMERGRARSSIMLPNLQPKEKEFFSLVSSGNVAAVEQFLKDNKDFNINCVNFQGATALRIAIQAHNEEMMKLLMKQEGIDFGASALYAVRENQPGLLELILNRMSEISPELEFAGAQNSAEFPESMTPLLLASQLGNFELIEMLLERGHRIMKPHPPRCTCPEVCLPSMKSEDSLKLANERLDLYRAIANPTYMCLSSDDPILTAFQLYAELRDCAAVYSAFRTAYLELAAAVRDFPVNLIGCCRSSAEVELILKQRAGSDFPGNVMFPRLMLAIDYNQKEFVAHPNTQKALEVAWQGEWFEWQKRGTILKLLTVFGRIFMLPVITVLCIVAPNSQRVEFYRLPVNKMISSAAAYLVFLVLVFCESNLDKRKQKRGPPQSGLEGILVLFVGSYLWSLIRMGLIQGPRRFSIVHCNWYDILTHGLFTVSFVFWLVALIDVQQNDSEKLERKYWNSLDPTLIAEGFFTVATIFAFARLLVYLQFSYHLGPLQVAMGKMTKDIGKFLVIFGIILLSFSAGLSTFYEYYQGMIQTDLATGSKTTQEPSFINFESTLKTLFWALFCMSPLESADVIIENLPAKNHNGTYINKHQFTQTVGYICFAMFEIIIVIVFLNMLVACMCNTMQKVIDNVDVEWTYRRTEVLLNYMTQTTLPPPLNLIPTCSGLASMVEWCSLLQGPKDGKHAMWSLTHCCYIETDVEPAVEQDFPVLMSELGARYFAIESQQDKTAEVESIRQEVEDLKTLVQELRDNRSKQEPPEVPAFDAQ